jgi:para-aminobenzoate synthetase / 4-amino-4-deoxychorismate lyase
MTYSFPIDSLDRLIAAHETCVFLDTARPDREQRYSLLFTNPRRILRCRRAADVGTFLEELSRESATSWIAGFMAYEAAYGLEDKFGTDLYWKEKSDTDLAWFGVFDEPLVFDHLTGKWNRPLEIPGRRAVRKSTPCEKPAIEIRGLLPFNKYAQKIRAVKRLIAAGDVYQVNFTYEVLLKTRERPWELYKTLRTEQPVPFGAFIKTREGVIASLSPELFFMQQGDMVRVRPMKGTAPRGLYAADDREIAERLARDPKNRSENIMIVDLLRNDLGKICATGSVAVERLFEVERHPTIHQMTSTVEGRLRESVDLAGLFAALFPCGSVTGAPKIRAMEIIRECEKRERGVYCGAIGYSSPGRRRVFSVPIRTLQKKTAAAQWRFGVGSGIVGDSTPMQERQECVDKCNFLSTKYPDFKLVETALFAGGRFSCLREHRKRLFDSARYFGYAVKVSEWEKTAAAIRRTLAASKARHKVRIVVDRSGNFSWEHERLADAWAAATPFVFISEKPVDPATPFLYHKTTYRPWYREDRNRIRSSGCFDVLHVNSRGQLTEGSRTNLFVKINGALFTPPVRCGLLPGVLRNRLLDAGKCTEKILSVQDLKNAEALYCGNSVRGLVEVILKSKI